MNLAEFDYPLPQAAIAQEPSEQRDRSRLMVLRRVPPTISHHLFHEITGHLSPGDVLVLNRAKVPPCRLRGRKTTGGAVELLLLKPAAPSPSHSPRPTFGGCPASQQGAPASPRGRGNPVGETWECLLKPSSRIRHGQEILFAPSFSARVRERVSPGRWSVEFFSDRPVREELHEAGLPPLPPYIRRPKSGRLLRDREWYQTVYADREGGVAAPTAGFHFTRELLMRLRQKGIRIAALSLFPGTGSFQPLRSEYALERGIPPEEYEIDQKCADMVMAAKRSGKKVVAVGTTTVRALESWASLPVTSGLPPYVKNQDLTPLFIAPGYTFRIVDAIITNFHLPRTTHLLLVAAFLGRERLLQAYSLALEEGYRFLSYGDAMLVL